mmetsp:Transcript_28242/g.63975  ORF Transcript_28242/g.63975 Transcript_28242/m.63975 type:complete len:98 (+) Transcript_28242:110-403(+)
MALSGQIAKLVLVVCLVATCAEPRGKISLADGRSCSRKCGDEVKQRWDQPCKHLRERLKDAPKGHEHSIKNALAICEQSEKHHKEACQWQCWHEDEL